MLLISLFFGMLAILLAARTRFEETMHWAKILRVLNTAYEIYERIIWFVASAIVTILVWWAIIWLNWHWPSGDTSTVWHP
jgi:hypothetical protein